MKFILILNRILVLKRRIDNKGKDLFLTKLFLLLSEQKFNGIGSIKIRTALEKKIKLEEILFMKKGNVERL